MRDKYWCRGAALAVLVVGCSGENEAMRDSPLDKYATVRLTTDLSALTDSERAMIPLLIEAAEPMNDLFWVQALGDRDSLLSSIEDPELRRFAEINYGPWDRLADDQPFLPHTGPKPPGANLYPGNMSKEEFEAAMDAPLGAAEALRSLYTLVRRGPEGRLRAVPYHEAFAERLGVSASKLREAAALAEEPGLKRYLELRASAILTDEFRESDMAWMDMKDNALDIVIGPIETYEDKLFGYKAGYEALVLVKDKSWSERLAVYATLLPELQTGLPVPDSYKRETPGTESDLNAYDVVYYAGEANAGSKSIAVNLPNDETVQLEKGTRRLQLKNSMRAKFDEILVPLADVLIAEDQRRHITFDAFFGNTMFHEVAHGLGVKNTINDRGTVREALQEHASPMEEGKADVLGLYMITTLFDDDVLTDGSVEDHYVTFLASIFRSVRFGASSAHGRTNMARFNFFKEYGAFTRDETSGTYEVDFAKMKTAMTALSELILTLQGDGDYEGAGAFLEERGIVTPELQADLDRVGSAGIPVDIIFEQGAAVVGAVSSEQ
jgi:hypothetical protein